MMVKTENNLSVKRIALQQVEALELLAVRLVHGEGVLLPLEHLRLVRLFGTTPREVTLS